MIRKVAVWIVVAVLCGIVLVAIALRVVISQHERRRAAWATAAITRLSELSTTNDTIKSELADIRTSVAADNGLHWTGDHVLVMTNGDYLVYEFRHGFNNGWIDHLFIARDNRARWWYSTFHFCNGMVMVGSDTAPSSVEDFSRRYAAREFPGRAEACLGATWNREFPR